MSQSANVLEFCDVEDPKPETFKSPQGSIHVYLSRRNIMTLLDKLDFNIQTPGASQCTLVKNDVDNTRFPQSHPEIWVTAVEDKEYYWDRTPGYVMHLVH